VVSPAAGARFFVATVIRLLFSNDEGLSATTGAWAQAATIAVVSATANTRRTPLVPGRKAVDRPGRTRSAPAPWREAAEE
jgi:hypothetical protein